jgi:hypothetical protein
VVTPLEIDQSEVEQDDSKDHQPEKVKHFAHRSFLLVHASAHSATCRTQPAAEHITVNTADTTGLFQGDSWEENSYNLNSPHVVLYTYTASKQAKDREQPEAESEYQHHSNHNFDRWSQWNIGFNKPEDYSNDYQHDQNLHDWDCYQKQDSPPRVKCHTSAWDGSYSFPF